MSGKTSKRKRETPRRLGRGLAGMMSDAVPVSRGTGNTTPGNTSDADAPRQQGGAAVPTPSSAAEVSPPGELRSGGVRVDDPQFVYISIGNVRPSPYQPRSEMDEASLDELAASIRTQGVMQPILVRPAAAGGYELVAGERRWRAAQKAGLEEIPAIVRELEDQAAAEFALVENIQREDLGPIERAQALRALLDQFGLTQQVLADRLGLERSSVANQVRLLDLGDEIVGMIESGALTTGHGKALLAVILPDDRLKLARSAVKQQWSVRALERAVRGELELRKAARDKVQQERHPAVRDLESRLRDYLGTGVSIRTDKSGKRGKLVLEFYDLDQFDGLLHKLGLPEEH